MPRKANLPKKTTTALNSAITRKDLVETPDEVVSVVPTKKPVACNSDSIHTSSTQVLPEHATYQEVSVGVHKETLSDVISCIFDFVDRLQSNLFCCEHESVGVYCRRCTNLKYCKLKFDTKLKINSILTK